MNTRRHEHEEAYEQSGRGDAAQPTKPPEAKGGEEGKAHAEPAETDKES